MRGRSSCRGGANVNYVSTRRDYNGPFPHRKRRRCHPSANPRVPLIPGNGQLPPRLQPDATARELANQLLVARSRNQRGVWRCPRIRRSDIAGAPPHRPFGTHGSSRSRKSMILRVPKVQWSEMIRAPNYSVVQLVHLGSAASVKNYIA